MSCPAGHVQEGRAETPVGRLMQLKIQVLKLTVEQIQPRNMRLRLAQHSDVQTVLGGPVRSLAKACLLQTKSPACESDRTKSELCGWLTLRCDGPCSSVDVVELVRTS